MAFKFGGKNAMHKGMKSVGKSSPSKLMKSFDEKSDIKIAGNEGHKKQAVTPIATSRGPFSIKG